MCGVRAMWSRDRELLAGRRAGLEGLVGGRCFGQRPRLAQELIGEHGLDDVCMEDVAAAGVGKGTVFRRFGDREGLVLAVVANVRGNWLEQARCTLSDERKSAAERVVAFAGRLLDHILDTLPLMRAYEQVSEQFRCGDDLEPVRGA